MSHGIANVNTAIANGNVWYIRSDIKDFFTRIPKQKVIDFVRAAVDDGDFIDLFKRALETNLENKEELEERNLFKLFPDEKTGVAQGSALSALAGNIALREFDADMNSRGLICVGYIDDFILLGKNEVSVRRGYAAAREILSAMGMDAYDLNDFNARKTGKVDAGNIYNGTDFLGYRISGFSRQPCRAACQRFVEKLDVIVRDAKNYMRETRHAGTANPNCMYYQSMVKLNGLVWGWSQSFKHTTARQVFAQLDKEVDRAIAQIAAEARRLIRSGPLEMGRRISGIHLLIDTRNEPLPNVACEFTATAPHVFSCKMNA